MGCRYTRLLSPKEALQQEDGELRFHVMTGGLSIYRQYDRQNIPSGTLFVTDTRLIHVTRRFGLNRIVFELADVSSLKSSYTFARTITYPCCTQRPDGYVTFNTTLDGKTHQIGVKVRDCERITYSIKKLKKKFFKVKQAKRLSDMPSTSSSHAY